MRVRRFTLALALAAGLAPGAADAGTLVAATWTQHIQPIPTIPGIALTVTNSGATCTDTNPARVPGAGFLTCPTAGLQATGQTAGTSYAVSLTMPLFQMQAFTTGGVINLGTRATLSGAQSIVGNAVSATVTQGIPGTVKLGGAMHTRNSMWSQAPGGTLLILPLSVGKAGEFTFSPDVLGSTFYLTVDFYAWTPGTLTFAGLTWRGTMPLPDVVAMGTFGLTPNGAGTVTLVSPTKISFDGPAAQQRTASFATLKLTFVPEPATLLLLGAGALALAWLRKPDRGHGS